MSDLGVMAILQTDSLLNGSIGDNISFFDEHLDVNRIVECAKLVGLHEQIATMPMRYETLVGPNISSLSAGQVQRELLARSLYLNQNILILDEATSSVDNETEAAIQRSLDILKQDRTVIVIAHRLSTVRNADIIYVLENGDVVESGNHESLLEINGVYAKLWSVQTGEKI